MRKLLVLLLALVMIVAVFAQEAAQAEEAPAITLEDVAKDVEALKDEVAKLGSKVSVLEKPVLKFSGGISAGPSITYSATANTIEASIGVDAYLIMTASNKDDTTGFSINFARTGSISGEILYLSGTGSQALTLTLGYGTQVWHKILSSDNLSLTLRAGLLSRGWATRGLTFLSGITRPLFVSRNRTAALAFDANISAGDLKDNLIVYVHTPSATQIDLDVYNKLDFSFLSVGFLARNAFSSSAAGSMPKLGINASVDLAKALNIENAKLSGFGYLAVDPGAGSITSMLEDYLFGFSFEYEKFNGGLVFAYPNSTSEAQIGVVIGTKIFSPVDLQAEVTFKSAETFTEPAFAVTASFKQGLLKHSLQVTYEDKLIGLGWSMSAEF